MQNKPIEPKSEEWQVYWMKIYNRIERLLSWSLISLGLILLSGYGLYKLILNFTEFVFNSPVPVIIKISIFLLIMGVVILFVSIIREKIYLNQRETFSKEEL